MEQNSGTLSLFMEAGRLIRSRMERAMPLTPGKCEVLRFIEEEGRPTMRAIARRFNITAPSATAGIEELVRLGLVKRVPDPADRRQIRCTLTDKGKRLNQRIVRTRRSILVDVLSPITEEDRADFDRVLRKIISHA